MEITEVKSFTSLTFNKVIRPNIFNNYGSIWPENTLHIKMVDLNNNTYEGIVTPQPIIETLLTDIINNNYLNYKLVIGIDCAFLNLFYKEHVLTKSVKLILQRTPRKLATRVNNDSYVLTINDMNYHGRWRYSPSRSGYIGAPIYDSETLQLIVSLLESINNGTHLDYRLEFDNNNSNIKLCIYYMSHKDCHKLELETNYSYFTNTDCCIIL